MSWITYVYTYVFSLVINFNDIFAHSTRNKCKFFIYKVIEQKICGKWSLFFFSSIKKFIFNVVFTFFFIVNISRKLLNLLTSTPILIVDGCIACALVAIKLMHNFDSSANLSQQFQCLIYVFICIYFKICFKICSAVFHV